MKSAILKLLEIVFKNAVGCGVGVLTGFLVLENFVKPNLGTKGVVYVIDYWPGPFDNPWLNLWASFTVAFVLFSLLGQVLKLAWRQRKAALTTGGESDARSSSTQS